MEADRAWAMAKTALEDSAGRARRAFEGDWTTACAGGGGRRGDGRYIECSIAKLFQEMIVEERAGDKGIRYMFLQNRWRTVFGAAQYLKAETL